MALNLPAGWSYDYETGRLTVPDDVTTIDRNNSPFYNPWTADDEITKVDFTGLTLTIGDRAFFNCSGLKKVIIPESVVVVDNWAFVGTAISSIGPLGSGCDLEINAREDGLFVTGIGMANGNGNASSGNPNVTEIIIPNGTTKLQQYCVLNFENLRKLVVPATVETCGSSWLKGCPLITSAGPLGSGCDLEFGWTDKIPDNGLYISGITKVIIPDNAVIGNSALNGNSIKEIIVPGSATFADNYSVFSASGSGDVYFDGTRSQWTVLNNEGYTIHCTDDDDVDTWYDEKFGSASTEPEVPTDPTEPTTPETPDTPGESANPDEEALAITPAMLQLIVTQILGKVNERIAGRIVTSISDASDDNHVPSALAVFNFLRTLTPGMSCQTVVGSMDTITDPDSQIIYLQKDDETDPTWTMYLWVDGAWVGIGDTSIDLVNYWSKSDADIAELREKILGQESLDAIKDSLDLTDVLRNDEASKEIVTGWMNEYLGTDMTNIVNNVMSEVEKVYVKKEDLPAAIAVITEAQITAAVNGAFAATEPQI